MADLDITHVDAVSVVEIRRPPANYFDQDLLRDIADACEELQQGRTCRSVVLCSQGKHFCAGADFSSSVMETDRDSVAEEIYREGIRLFALELPIVAAVQGVAAGGGLGLACAADFRVASSASRFHANFASLGFHHGFGLSVTLPRIVGEQAAARLLLLAERIGGEQALAIGLVDRLAEPGAEREAALALAEAIAAQAPLAVRSMRQTLRGALAGEVSAALTRELAEQQRLWRTEDSRIGITASIARRAPRFVGA
jgi:2-(1,2-epoxy-1,2-dihydrophenyl)acetyl-CoA isomerase